MYGFQQLEGMTNLQFLADFGHGSQQIQECMLAWPCQFYLKSRFSKALTKHFAASAPVGLVVLYALPIAVAPICARLPYTAQVGCGAVL